MPRHASPHAGVLPQTEDVVLAGVALPHGRLIGADPSLAYAGVETDEEIEHATRPVAWITDEPVAKIAPLWRQLAARFSDTGLWPLVMESLGSNQEGRPWLTGELDPSCVTDPSQFAAPTILDEQWRKVIPSSTDDPDAMHAVHPFAAEFPGLASATTSPDDGEALGAVVAELAGRLGLVAVQRPADAVAALGWTGPCNYGIDMGALAVVLRSWEDRFGAYVVGIGFQTLSLGVQRPPTTMPQALAIAAEHFAICPDLVYQGEGSLEAYAEELLDRPDWSLWWD